MAQTKELIAQWVYEHNYLRLNKGMGGISPYEAFIEGKSVELDVRKEGNSLILKFINELQPRPLRINIWNRY